MCENTTTGPLQRLVSYSKTNAVFTPTSKWMPVSGLADDILFNLLQQSLDGTFTAQPGIQLARVRPDNPELPMAVGSVSSSNGYESSTYSATGLNIGDFFYWRFGVFGVSTDGFGQADVRLSVSFDSRGKILGRQSIDVQPFNDNTQTAVYPISGWHPVVAAKNVKAAFVIADNQYATLRYRLFMRSADDSSAPNAWTALEAGWTAPPVGNSERNTGEILLGASGAARFQLGVGVMKNGTSETRATIHVASAQCG